MTPASPPPLSAVPSTLRIPLAARALGGTLFPQLEVGDTHASRLLQAMGDDGQQWLQDRQSTYGVLARTLRFRDHALAFLARHPSAHVANLGCGLSHYLQWLDNGQLRMTDADLPEVMALRQQLLPTQSPRHAQTVLDLSDPQWWDALGLPATRDEPPVFLFSEGVFMYLTPSTVHAILTTFGKRAPAGSVLCFDAMCWLAMGRAKHHTSVRKTHAEFQWGPRKLADLTRPHPRLQLRNSDGVMAGYSLFYRLLEPAFRTMAGVPFYAVYALEAKN